MKTKPNTVKPNRIQRKRGEHLWHEHDGITKCVTCFCDEDDAFCGGQECSYGQKPDWQPK